MIVALCYNEFADFNVFTVGSTEKEFTFGSRVVILTYNYFHQSYLEMTVNAGGTAINSSCVHVQGLLIFLGFDNVCQFYRALVGMNRSRSKDIFF